MSTTKNPLPVLPTRNAVIFPGVTVPLRIGRAKSVKALEQAMSRKTPLLTVAQKANSEGDDPGLSDLHPVGTACEILSVRGSAEEGFQVIVRGTERVRLAQVYEKDGYIQAETESLPDILDVEKATEQGLIQSIKELAKRILDLLPANTEEIAKLVEAIQELPYLCHLCLTHLDAPLTVKQELLANQSVKGRAMALLELLQNQKSSLEVQNEIREKLTSRIGKAHRENILREQMRTIQDELGDGDRSGREQEYRKKIEDAGMPESVKKIALDELKRLEATGNQSPESHVIRNYLDLLCALPWSKASEKEIDLDEARAILEADHYGLAKIKRRIVEHLAVFKLKKGLHGSILLFVGPPGVGKTSLGQSIAKALGRKFVRASLGGVRDDAEIRGHRRTYVGAMPGRIIQGIKRAAERNPVFMLDEIDKLSHGFHGDPAAALLEVLDPEQNSGFMDHYLDVPFDLSKVFFIATANTTETIPAALLDRMELIELGGYTTAEKLHIARRHLIPKQLEEHGLKEGQVELSDEVLSRIITHHTREAGVRELQRKIAAALRGSVEKVLAGDVPARVAVGQLEDLIGNERHNPESAERSVPPGVVTGLAWTPQGGDILFIESASMPGTGKLTLTGQLGDVMKESAQIALSLARTHLALLSPGLDFEKRDIHIHVPAGAIPKDGPSAGVALLVSIASMLSGRAVDTKLAMTGEITLRGVVMPVGGIKEKVLAAHRAGITRVILCRKNEKDLKEVPEEVRSALKFELVESAGEVMRLALGFEALPIPAIASGAAAVGAHHVV